jgi:hypothetical protein
MRLRVEPSALPLQPVALLFQPSALRLLAIREGLQLAIGGLAARRSTLFLVRPLQFANIGEYLIAHSL